MNQLTFGDNLSEEKQKKKESWYKGRTLSHSSISTYQQCPQKWKFRYIDKVPERPRSFFSFGKSVHSGMEYLFAQMKESFPALEKVLTHYREGWLSEGYETPAQEKWFFKEGERILKGFYAKHKDDRKKVVDVELKFTIDIEGVPVTGYIDRIDETASGGLGIVDYKTGKAFDKSRVRRDPQLTMYQLACRDVFGKEVETVTLYHLNSLTPLTVPAHTAHQEKELKALVVTAAQGINEKKFEPQPEPTGYCRWCDYMQICPAFANKGNGDSRKIDVSKNVSEEIDRFGKLVSRIESLSEEKAEVEKMIRSFLKQAGKTSLDSDHFAIHMNQDDSLKIEEKK